MKVSKKIFDFHRKNILIAGVVGGQPALVIAKKNLKNVPKSFFGTAAWFGDLNIQAEQLYFD